jgi:hypothetical protein
MEDPKTLSAEEIQAKREAARKRKADQRARDKAKGIARENRKPEPMYPAKIKENEKAAKDFLRDAGIQNGHVADTILTLAEINDISFTALKVEPSWSNELVEGEIIYRTDLEGLRQFSCPATTEADFRESRYRCKTDHFFLGNEALERPNTFCEQPHRAWVDGIFMKKTPTLKPDYTEADIKKWFEEMVAANGGKHRSFMACSRQSQKSTTQIIDAVQYLLNVPDVRIMQISAVKDLAKKFIKFFRFYWTIEDVHNRKLFAKWFPEMMIYADEKSDSNTFFCPMAHLGLGPSMVATSADASQTGARFCLGIFDDMADDLNEATSEGRIKLVEKYDSINKLRAEYGVTLTIGTPQNADRNLNTGDLYAVILGRSEKSDHQYLRSRIDPAWVLKEEYAGASPYEVVDNPEWIEKLLFPSKLSLDFLKEELATSSEKSFRRQYLLEWTDAEDLSLKLQFERHVLQSHMINRSYIPQEGIVHASGDTAFNYGEKSKYRDESCFTIFNATPGKLIVLDQVAGHYKDSEKAQTIVELTRKFNIQGWLIEKFPMCERLHEDVMRLAQMQNVRVNLFFEPVESTKNRKFHAIKSIETYLNQGIIKFADGGYLDGLFNQLENLHGTTAARQKGLDDRADSLALGIKRFRIPSVAEETDGLSEFQKDEEKKLRQQQHYDMIFGDTSNYTYYKGPTQAPVDSGREIGITRGQWGIPGLRTPAVGPRPDPDKKPMSFGDLAPRKKI